MNVYIRKEYLKSTILAFILTRMKNANRSLSSKREVTKTRREINDIKNRKEELTF